MDERHEEEQFESAINWDEEFKEMMRAGGEEEQEVNYIAGTLKLYANPIGFEFQFCDEGQKPVGYLITDVQAAQLALTIMAVIGNR